jgi:hypothetical protein
VLVVDDDRAARESFGRVLVKVGFEVREVVRRLPAERRTLPVCVPACVPACRDGVAPARPGPTCGTPAWEVDGDVFVGGSRRMLEPPALGSVAGDEDAVTA